MENILYDLSLITAGKNIEDTYFFDMDSLIYQKYQIDSLTLSQNMIYYSSQPEQYIQMLQNVQNRILEKDSVLQQDMKDKMLIPQTK